MNNLSIDMVYDFLKKNKTATFKKISDFLVKEKAIEEKNQEKFVVNLYTNMIMDNRFILVQDGEWGLRENFKFDEIKKYMGDVLNSVTFDDTIDIDNTSMDLNVADHLVSNTTESNDDTDFDNDEKEELDGFMDVTEQINWSEVEEELEENN